MNARYQDRRRRQLAAIHATKHKLGLDDDTYRDLLERVGGHRSAADMNAMSRTKVLRELRRLAGDTTVHARDAVPAPDAPRHARESAAPMLAKIGAMLADAERGWNYAHGMARRMFGVQRVEWLPSDQMRKLIAALEYDKRRRRKEPNHV